MPAPPQGEHFFGQPQQIESLFSVAPLGKLLALPRRIADHEPLAMQLPKERLQFVLRQLPRRKPGGELRQHLRRAGSPVEQPPNRVLDLRQIRIRQGQRVVQHKMPLPGEPLLAHDEIAALPQQQGSVDGGTGGHAV